MLTIYHSNRPELFIKLMTDIMSNQHISHPIQSEIILTENKTTAQWIEIQLLNHFSIVANINFMSIKSFIQKMLLEILPNNFVINNLSYNFMYWKFMEILPKIQFQKNCSIIRNYLTVDVNQQKCSQLSEELTNLFLKYLVYRLDWLEKWKNNKIISDLDIENQLWQSEVWRTFLQYIKYTSKKMNKLDDYLFSIHKNIQVIHSIKLPNRVFIYGITSIPPVYWTILDILCERVDMYLWILNPFIKIRQYMLNKEIKYYSNYQSFIFNKCSSSNNTKSNVDDNKNQDNCIVIDHTLLNACNKIGQDTLLLINQLKNSFEIKAFVNPKESQSMLHVLQNNILEFRDEILKIQENEFYFINLKNRQKFILRPEDNSISIHICCNVQREIEVLHDNLLLMLSKDPLLLPGEIIVMAPNIKDYIPAIETVFNNIFKRQLPFSIASNYSKQHTHPIISSILKILNISHIRFTTDEILSLLSVSSIASKFSINSDDIKLLNKWVIESGIRWGLDEKTVNNLNFSISDQNTWYFGFKRMLLGFAMKSKDGIWENILPYDYTNEDHIHIISQLGVFLETLKKWRDRLQYSYTLKIWILYAEEIINDFFYCSHINSEENKILIFLKTCWIDILESGIKAGYSKTINAVALQEKLNQKLKQSKINCKFIPNAINFCDISSISYIPRKVLCFIGMNYNMYPRNVSYSNFNLIPKQSRCGDSNIREEDCYIFLLLILLAKDRIYISWIENAIHYNSVLYNQSSIIDALITYIACNFYLKNNKYCNIKYNIECVRKYLLQYHSHMPFDHVNFFSDSRTQSFAKEWLNAATVNIIHDKYPICSDFITSLPWIDVTTIGIQDLYHFYRHPIQVWFQKRLGVFFKKTNEKLPNTEPFFPDNKDSFTLNLKLINYLMQNKDTDGLYRESCMTGKLPHGSFGKLYWMKKYNQMLILSNKIKKYYSPEIRDVNVSLIFDNIKLIGRLHLIQKNGLVRWTPSYLSMRDCFLLWLEHLIYCAIGGDGDSRLFGINNMCHFPHFSILQAKELLSSLISGYCTGINEPLMLLYRSGGAWINQISSCHDKIICLKEICQKKARQKLVESWNSYRTDGGNLFNFSESHDPYLRKIIPLYLREQDIQKIIIVSKYYLSNLVQYRIS